MQQLVRQTWASLLLLHCAGRSWPRQAPSRRKRPLADGFQSGNIATNVKADGAPSVSPSYRPSRGDQYSRAAKWSLELTSLMSIRDRLYQRLYPGPGPQNPFDVRYLELAATAGRVLDLGAGRGTSPGRRTAPPHTLVIGADPTLAVATNPWVDQAVV